jgi:hypothetical protein
MNNPVAKRRIPTAAEVLDRQMKDTEPGGIADPRAGTAVAVPDTRGAIERYLDELAPASMVGRMMKFGKSSKSGKSGVFYTTDDGAEVKESTEFVVLADQTLTGLIKFNGEGVPPDRHMGLLFDGYIPPKRESLGDLDENKWPEGLDGEPTDPWQRQICLVLQETKTAELFTFSTLSKTGHRAVVNLLRHYNRMTKTNPDEYPVVKLQTSGFNHHDQRIGWVPTPMFTVIGRRSRDSVAKPDTSASADMNDSVPF